MPPIRRQEMGEVWPAVEPGRGRGDLGSALLEPQGPFPIRSFQTLGITYTVGRFGLDDTGAIRIALRWVHDCGPLQTTDPGAMNHVTARASNGVPLEVLIEPHGYRPWNCAIRVTVTGGYLSEGDRITVTLGDRSQGAPGLRLQTIAEPDFELRVSVDACATGQFSEIDERLSLAIAPGPPVLWKVVAPGLRRPGEPFAIGLKAEDAWGNPAPPGPATLHLAAEGPVAGLPETVSFEAGARGLGICGLSVAGEATCRIAATAADGMTLATSEPIVIRDGPLAGYWGDLHGQSGETVGIGTLDEYLTFARDLAFLDVSGHQANDFQITNAFWERINRTTEAMNEDGRFIVFPGYEWSGNTPVGGDHNVFFRHEGRQIRRSSHAMLSDRSDIGTDANTLDALFAALADEDCVLWAHVGGRPADVGYAHDPKLKTAVEVHSNWGTFEWILTDSLALGHRVGVVSNSDGHKGRPGAGPPGATEFGAYGGLTCFLAPELTRDALFECMRRRHHYGTSGSRMFLDVRARFDGRAALYRRDPRHFDVAPERVTAAMMGDIVGVADGAVTLGVEIAAAVPVERVDVLSGAELIATRRPYGREDLGRRVRVYWQGAEYRGRGRNTFWRGEIAAQGAEIAAMAAVNQWNPERPVTLHGSDRVSFEAVTSGNFAGVDLTLSTPEARLAIATNHVSGEVAVGDLGLDDRVLDAGGLGRGIVVRRLPDRLDPAPFAFTLPVEVAPEGDTAIWVRVTTLDGHQAWSSPIYLWRA